MNPALVDEFARASARLMQLIGQFRKVLSARDLELLKVGMREGHVLEARRHGEHQRAMLHQVELDRIVPRLGRLTVRDRAMRAIGLHASEIEERLSKGDASGANVALSALTAELRKVP